MNMNFQQNVKKITSQNYQNKSYDKNKINNNTLNEKEIFIQRKPKQQLQKKKKQFRQKIARQNNEIILKSRYKRLIKKYNNNYFNMLRILKQNEKLITELQEYPLVKKKIQNIFSVSKQLNAINNFVIFLQDIDQNIFQNKINGGM